MVDFDWDKVTEIALRTWYPKDHNLHFNPHHPLGKLVGEWGELLDDYMKSIYKPGYIFEPEDELGDIWYYLRILCYQQDYEPSVFTLKGDTDYLVSSAINETSRAFIDLLNRNYYSVYALDVTHSVLYEIAARYRITLEQLTESNWQKLKPGSERGKQWARARIETDYVNSGKIGEIT